MKSKLTWTMGFVIVVQLLAILFLVRMAVRNSMEAMRMTTAIENARIRANTTGGTYHLVPEGGDLKTAPLVKMVKVERLVLRSDYATTEVSDLYVLCPHVSITGENMDTH